MEDLYGQSYLAGAFLILSYITYVLWDYRDGRAFGTKRRDDLHSTNDRTFLLGDLLSMIKNADRALDSMFFLLSFSRSARLHGIDGIAACQNSLKTSSTETNQATTRGNHSPTRSLDVA
jgi:hypothetical protein